MKRLLLTLLKVGISLALIALFLRRVEWRDLQTAFASADAAFCMLAVLLFALSNLLGAFQWRELLLTQGITLPVWRVISLYFVGVFFNNFLVSNIGGDAVRIYELKRLTGRGLPGFAATFLDRFIGLFTLICFAIVAYAFSPELWGPALWMPILALGCALLGVLVFGFSRRLSGFMLGIGRRIFPPRFIGFLEDVREGFMLYRHTYRMLGRVGLLAAGVQLCRIGVYYAAGHALGQEVGFQYFVIFIPLIAIVAAIPISFGGIGVRENMGVLLFGRVGMDPAPALAVMLLGYLSGIVASLAGGVVFVLRRLERGEGGVADGSSIGTEGCDAPGDAGK